MAYLRQWQVGLSLSLAALVTGFALGWTSPYIAKLTATDNNHPLKLTSSEASWIVSLLFLGKLFGCVLGAIIQELIGRKKTLLCGGGPFVVGWMSTLIATSVPWLYASRLFCGLAIGIVMSALTLFIGEIADPKIRGALMFWNMNAILVGVFLGNAMGTLLTMEIFSCVSIAVTVIFIVLGYFVPESPYYHLSKSNIDEAEKSLQWYTSSVDVRKALEELEEYANADKANFSTRIEELKKPKNLCNLMVVCCLHLTAVCAGSGTMSSYAEIILIKSKISIEPSSVVMASSLFTIVANFLTTHFIDKFGRKTLLIASGLGVCVAQLLFGLQFHLLSSNHNLSFMNWLPIFALFLYYLAICSGLGTIPQVLVSELFPHYVKTPAMLCFGVIGSLMPFVVSKSFQPYVDLVGETLVFCTFAVSAIFSVIITYYFVYETKQMSLVDIQTKTVKSSRLVDKKY